MAKGKKNKSNDKSPQKPNQSLLKWLSLNKDNN